MKERGIIVCTLIVGFIYLVARLARQWKNFYGVSAEFIYLAARFARQWMKERGIIVCTLIAGFIYLVARLARQWIKERGIIDMRIKAGLHGEFQPVF